MKDEKKPSGQSSSTTKIWPFYFVHAFFDSFWNAAANKERYAAVIEQSDRNAKETERLKKISLAITREAEEVREMTRKLTGKN